MSAPVSGGVLPRLTLAASPVTFRSLSPEQQALGGLLLPILGISPSPSGFPEGHRLPAR